MAKGDKISVNLQKLEGSMDGIMNQMGLGVNIAGGGSQGIPKKSKKSLKKGEKGGSGGNERSKNVYNPGSAASQAQTKPGGVGTVDKIGDVKPGKKKEDKSTADIGDTHRRKP